MTMKFKILAADKLAEEGLDFISSQPDTELTNKPGITVDELAKIAGDYHGIIVRSGVDVTAEVMANPGILKAVARAGVGVDNIDLNAATEKGILVLNSAQASTTSTAEHAFALMISLARNIGPAYQAMALGRWDRAKFMGWQLSGKTLGVIGFGRIGQTVALQAIAFGMNVIAYDPFFNKATALDGKVKIYSDFKELLPHADVLTFHVPLTDQTKGMLGEETFGLCREGVKVVNAARGGIVCESALLKAIESGQCGGAALDVYPSEPLAEGSALRNHPKILTTPHLGASTKEAQTAVSVGAAEALLTYLRGEGLQGAVNAGGIKLDLDPTQSCLVDLAERMAMIISSMVTQGFDQINIELHGSMLIPARATIERSCLIGLLDSHMDASLNIVNVKHFAKERGIVVNTTTSDEETAGGPWIGIEIRSPEKDGQVQTRRITGKVYSDLKPRVTEINGYHMDIVPHDDMVLIQNDDQPGMIGTVGNAFGDAHLNIAEMAISRREHTALMVLCVDQTPSEEQLKSLSGTPGILKAIALKLPRIK